MARDSLRVCIVVPSAAEGGSAEILLNLIRNADRAGLVLDIVELQRGPLNQRIAEHPVSHRVLPAGRIRDPRALFRVGRELVSHFGTCKPDIVLSWEAGAHPWTAIPARRAGLPSVFHQAGHPSRRVAVDVAATVLPGNGVLVASEFVASEQAKLWPHLRTRVVPYGISIDRFSGTGAKAAGALDAPVIAMVGRLSRWKRQHVFIEAAAAVQAVLPDARFLIAGGAADADRGYEAELRAQASSLKLSSSTLTFTGPVRDVERVYALADIAVHLSDHEPFGLVLLEAMAAGAPLISVREGAPPEIVTHQQTGVLLPEPSASALASELLRLAADGDRRARLAASAGAYVRTHGTAEAMARRMAVALRELAAATPR